MRLLVLGGTNFVGRAVVDDALRRGHEVTTLNRGVTGEPPVGVRALHADRTDPEAVRHALGHDEWDAVVDTWSDAPVVVRQSAALLADRVGHYGFVSSRSVYRWPIPSGADETAPVVDADPGSEGTDYAADKRGSELAVLEHFSGRSVLARAGLILGPHEDVGRLPWWLDRMRRGGRVLAPGPPDRPLQYIDARDLAAWMVTAAERGLGGVFNTVSRPGHTTTQELLELCRDVTGGGAELVWRSPEEIADAGLMGWNDLPIWAPPIGELAALHDGDVSAAYAAGLVCRPVEETVRDTWQWLETAGVPEAKVGRPRLGLDPDVERRLVG